MFNPVKGRAVATTALAVWFNGAREQKRGRGRAGELRIARGADGDEQRRGQSETEEEGEEGEEEAAAHIFAPKASFLDALGGEAGVHLDFASLLKTEQ